MEIKNTSSNSMDWGSAVGALGAIAGNLIGSGMTNKRMRAAQRRQQQYNLELMEKAQEYNVANFNMENEYNSPLHQRERMKAAGLNPNFVDGLSPVVGQMDMVSNPSGAHGDVAPVDANAMVNSIATLASIKRENKLAESQEQVNDSIISSNEANATKALSDAKLSDANVQKITDVDVPTSISQRNLNDAMMEDIWSQIHQRNSQIDIGYKQLNEIIRRTTSEISLNDESINNLRELREMAWKKLEPEIKNLDADTQLKIVEGTVKMILAKNDTARVGIESRAQQETARHNRAMEFVEHERNAIQSSLNEYVKAELYERALKTNVETKGAALAYVRGCFAHAIDTALLKSGYTGAMYAAKYREQMIKLDNMLSEGELTKERIDEIKNKIVQDWVQIGINAGSLGAQYLDALAPF